MPFTATFSVSHPVSSRRPEVFGPFDGDFDPFEDDDDLSVLIPLD
jgi:hypothetical protein